MSVRPLESRVETQPKLQPAYGFGRMSVTPALLRLDPHWDPLRADPAFQKLCEEKAK